MVIKNNSKNIDMNNFSNKEYIFTCIIAIYNVGNYLKETINSIINQTLDFQKYIQLILVNDGSTDISEEICLYYERIYPDNILYIKKENGGVSSARNLGMEYALGEYINFIDGDDYFSLNSLNLVNSFLNKNYLYVDFVAIELLNFNESFKEESSYYNSFYKEDRIIYLNDTVNFAIFNPGMIFIKNTLAKKYKFDEKIKIGEDIHYYYKILIDSPRCGVVKNAKYMHRIRENSASNSPRKIEDSAKLIDIVLLDLLIHSKIKNGNIQQFIIELVLNILYNEIIKRIQNESNLILLDFVSKIKKCLDYIDNISIENSIFITKSQIQTFLFIKQASSENAIRIFKYPKVSIIIPAYNAHKYLKEAIDSALNQTYKNIEIIVINDGSNDNTDKIAKSYGNKIKYFKKENGGVSSALNLGIKNMTGDYFSWLSHDDRYYPNKIADQIQYLNSIDLNSNVILYSDYDLMNSKSEVYDKCIKNHEELIQKPEYGLLRGSINGITLLIPKQAFEECGMFDENLRCTQDYELWVKMQNKYSFIHQPTILATTRIHNKQQGNTNPLMLKEGNPFWINFITNIPLATKEKLEGTEYNFYFEMLKFLESSPYKKTVNFINEKLLNIKNSSKEDIDNTLVSVIIPFYNRIDMVINAITSVINQTHKNIEIILINDGSTDNLEPILKFINNNDNIKLFSLENNSGPSNARNLGLEKASGQYVAFLDSDDIFIENKIEFQLQEMYLKGYLFSHTSYFKKSNNNKTLMDSGKLNGFVIPKIICECTIATPTIMINRQILNIKDFKYSTALNIGEDVCLYLSVLKDIPILGIKIPLTIVNVNENTSAYNYEKQQESIMNIIKFIINDPDLIKYDNEFACLLKIYINIINKKNPTFNLYQHNNSKSNLFNWLKRKFNLLKRLIWLFKNDRPALKELVIYKFNGHPKLFKILKFLISFAKKIKKAFIKRR